MINQHRLHELFDYCKDTGELVRRVSVKGSPKGTVIGTTKPSGYKVAVVDGYIVRLHKLVWIYHHGECDSELDHIDRDRGNNRIENLRPCSRTDNVCNSRAKGTGYKGVSFCNSTQRWRAQIGVDYSNKHIGRFDTPEEAALAYNKAATYYFGEFAYLNEIEDANL